jgi:hypothetical protein
MTASLSAASALKHSIEHDFNLVTVARAASLSVD